MQHKKLADGVSVGGWTIRTHHGPIMKTQQYEAFTEEHEFPSLPEMVHASSFVELTQEASQFSLKFETCPALIQWRSVCMNKAAIKVNYSKEWKEERKQQVEELGVATQKEFDWTFQTDYKGDLSPNATVRATQEAIPYNKLRVREPIMFHDEVILFHDELMDCGDTQLLVKLRVMPSGWFLLFRQFTRLDDVCFILRDTRFYHAFDQPGKILRESQLREATYAELNKSRLLGDDPTLVCSADRMSALLTQKQIANECIEYS